MEQRPSKNVAHWIAPGGLLNPFLHSSGPLSRGGTTLNGLDPPTSIKKMSYMLFIQLDEGIFSAVLLSPSVILPQTSMQVCLFLDNILLGQFPYRKL